MGQDNYESPAAVEQGTIEEKTQNATEGTTKPEEFNVTMVWDNIP